MRGSLRSSRSSAPLRPPLLPLRASALIIPTDRATFICGSLHTRVHAATRSRHRLASDARQSGDHEASAAASQDHVDGVTVRPDHQEKRGPWYNRAATPGTSGSSLSIRTTVPTVAIRANSVSRLHQSHWNRSRCRAPAGRRGGGRLAFFLSRLAPAVVAAFAFSCLLAALLRGVRLRRSVAVLVLLPPCGARRVGLCVSRSPRRRSRLPARVPGAVCCPLAVRVFCPRFYVLAGVSFPSFRLLRVPSRSSVLALRRSLLLCASASRAAASFPPCAAAAAVCVAASRCVALVFPPAVACLRALPPSRAVRRGLALVCAAVAPRTFLFVSCAALLPPPCASFACSVRALYASALRPRPVVARLPCFAVSFYAVSFLFSRLPALLSPAPPLSAPPPSPSTSSPPALLSLRFRLPLLLSSSLSFSLFLSLRLPLRLLLFTLLSFSFTFLTSLLFPLFL